MSTERFHDLTICNRAVVLGALTEQEWAAIHTALSVVAKHESVSKETAELYTKVADKVWYITRW